jgi:glucan 1,3-beta-glucosidase
MRGVNLGGWLVLEEWMTRDLFHNSGAWDQMSYDGQAQNNPQLRERLRNHWATFITPDDIQQISDAGLNAVRIPVGYWSVLGGGISGETYIAGALDYLNPVVEKCAQLGISVVIVLHGLPGSQNGQDNSGQSMGSTYQWFGNEYYKSKSVEAATRLVDLYGNGKYGGIVQSIALINEPKPRSDDDDIAFQKDFFRQAYDAIRANDPTMNVQYADGWRFPTQDSTWGGFANGQTSVSMDTHIYSLFHWETSGLGYNALLRWFCSRVDDVRSADANIPTIVGEWTAAVSMNCNDGDCSYWPDDRYYQHLARSFEAQTYVYEQGSGWVYWNWKLDRDDAWSFSTGIKQGWIPKDLSSKPHGTPCQFW